MNKQKRLKKLKKELWKVCSSYVKNRDGPKCITCGKAIESKKSWHCGHGIPKKVCPDNLKYDERILSSQCYFCNINLGGYGAMFYRKMIEKYGQEEVDKIFDMLYNKKKWAEQDFIDKIQYYKNLQNK